MRTRLNSVFRELKRPGSLLSGPGIPVVQRPGTPAFGSADLTDATSTLKAGGTVCPRAVTPFSNPIAIGAATANKPAVTSRAFVQPFRFFTILLSTIASILALRFDPDTPATHATGDSK